MSYADFKFIGNCKKILAEGFSDESFQVRPKWEDGTPAHTKKLLHVVDHYQLAQDSIPIMTMRKTGFKTCIGEILWIYQKSRALDDSEILSYSHLIRLLQGSYNQTERNDNPSAQNPL